MQLSVSDNPPPNLSGLTTVTGWPSFREIARYLGRNYPSLICFENESRKHKTRDGQFLEVSELSALPRLLQQLETSLSTRFRSSEGVYIALSEIRNLLVEAAYTSLNALAQSASSPSKKLKDIPINSGHPFFSRKSIGYGKIVVAESFGHLLSICASVDTLLLKESSSSYRPKNVSQLVAVEELMTRQGAVLDHLLSRLAKDPHCSTKINLSSSAEVEDLGILGIPLTPDLHIKAISSANLSHNNSITSEAAEAALVEAVRMAFGGDAVEISHTGTTEITSSCLDQLEGLILASPDGTVVVSGFALLQITDRRKNSRRFGDFDAGKAFPPLYILEEARVERDESEVAIILDVGKHTTFNLERLAVTTPGRIRQTLKMLDELRLSLILKTRAALENAFPADTTLTWSALANDRRIITSKNGAVLANSLEHLIAMTLAAHDVRDYVISRMRIHCGCDLRSESESRLRIVSMKDLLDALGLGSSYSFELRSGASDATTTRRLALRTLSRACGFLETKSLEENEMLSLLGESSSTLKNPFYKRYLALMGVTSSEWSTLEEIRASGETATVLWTRGYFANSGIKMAKRPLQTDDKPIVASYTPSGSVFERSLYSHINALHATLQELAKSHPTSEEGQIHPLLEQRVVITDNNKQIFSTSFAHLDIARRELECTKGGSPQFSPRWCFDVRRYDHFRYGVMALQADGTSWVRPDIYLHALPSSGQITPEIAEAALKEAFGYVTGNEVPEIFSAEFVTMRRFLKALTFKGFGAKKIVYGKDLLKLARGKSDTHPEDILGAKPITHSSLAPQALKESRISLYQQIFGDLELSTSAAFLALVALGYLRETRLAYKNFNEFIRRELEHAPREKRGPVSKKTVRTLFAGFTELHATLASTQKLTEEGRDSLRLFLQQLCYRCYDGNHGVIVRELEQIQSDVSTSGSRRELAAQLLTDIVPLLITRYRNLQSFKKPPGILFEPYDHQIEAALAARDSIKPIILFDPGAGKTEAAALWARLMGLAFLYLTKGALAPTTAQRLRKDCLPGANIVEFFELEKLSIEDFVLALAKVDGLVMSYDKLRSVERRRPDVFEAITKWIQERALICDEIHEIGNFRTLRWQAARNLNAKNVIVMTATPFRHTPARVAGVLHLALPHIYDDPASLENLLGDRELARAYTLKHATSYSLSDIARTFKPFSLTSAKKQLASGIPHIPSASEEVVPYRLSAANTREYIDRATNFKKWAKVSKLSTSGLDQYKALAELEFTGELVEAACKRARTILEKGEKIVFACERLSPLFELFTHPLLATYRPAFIRGSTHPRRRREILEDLQSRNGPAILVGQVRALGSGFDMPWAHEIVCMGRPLEVASLVQLKGRNIRIRSMRHADESLDHVRFVFLTPELDEKAVAEVTNERQKMMLKRGTMYGVALERLRERAEDLKGYTLRFGPAHALRVTSIDLAVSYLDSLTTQIKEKREDFALLCDQGLGHHYERHGSTIKDYWRIEYYGRFLKNNVRLLNEPLNDIQAVNVCGPLGLDTDTYVEAGIPKRNLTLCDADPDPRVRATAKQTAEAKGVRFKPGRLEALLAAKRYGVVGLDLDGYWTPHLVSSMIELSVRSRVMILKNATRQREQGKSLLMTKIWDNDRRRLDLEIMRLVGSSAMRDVGVSSPLEALKYSCLVQDVASRLSKKVAQLLEADHISVRDYFVQVVLKSSSFVKGEQMEYRNDRGRPLLSTFVVLERPHEPTGEECELALQLRLLFETVRALPESVKVSASASFSEERVRLCLGKHSVLVRRSSLTEALERFENYCQDKTSVDLILEKPLQIVR